ncbi:MAG: DUF4147 domain-containing protein, partial [Myxococcales bacterium]|nr:DUF4147 domain-containing protein [Myxococcales bacterium]
RASHPSAEEGALDAGRRAFALAESLSDEDTVVVLVSGGGSAMLESLLPGVPFDAFRALTDALRESGAAIDELNAVRMAFSAIKGGGLSEAFYPARVINVVVSDVPGMAPWLVASGPTLPAEAGAKLPDVRAILERRGVGDLVTPELLSALEREPPERRWDHIVTEIAADSRTARDAMVESARALGLRALAYPRFLTGEARLAGSIFVRGSLRQPTDVIVASGETTVRVAGKGRGGRNQEFVLGAAPLVGEGVLASMGTDGVDGSSPAAGALVDRTLLERAERKRLDRDAALENNDSYSYFAAAGGTLLTGPTGTNVADICVYVR